MEKITDSKALKERIEILEHRTKMQEQELKLRLKQTYESIKPQNLIKNAFSDATSEPEIRNNMVNTSVGLLTGMLTNKLLMSGSVGIIRKVAGPAIQFGITKLIINKFPAIKNKLQQLLHKKGANGRIDDHHHNSVNRINATEED